MRQHLILGQQRLDTSGTTAEELEEYSGREATEQLSFVTPVKGGDGTGRTTGDTKVKAQVRKGLQYHNPFLRRLQLC